MFFRPFPLHFLLASPLPPGPLWLLLWKALQCVEGRKGVPPLLNPQRKSSWASLVGCAELGCSDPAKATECVCRGIQVTMERGGSFLHASEKWLAEGQKNRSFLPFLDRYRKEENLRFPLSLATSSFSTFFPVFPSGTYPARLTPSPPDSSFVGCGRVSRFLEGSTCYCCCDRLPGQGSIFSRDATE